MFGSLSHMTLQYYWWVIISVLAGLLGAMLFVQGGQTLVRSVGKTEMGKSLIVNSLGRKWELGFTTLVLFGGALFAAFPLFYATSFGGAYFLWMSILFCFIIQAVSYEYRTKKGNFLGQTTYEIFLFINGSIGVFLLGVAIATLFNGAAFTLSSMKVVTWEGSLRGLESLISPFNILLGLSLVFLARILGAQYFINNIDDKEIVERSRKSIKINTALFLPFFLGFVVFLCFKKGHTLDPQGYVVMEAGRYFYNLLHLHIFGIGFLLIGVGAVLYSIYVSIFRDCKCPIWYGGAGTFLVVFALFISLGFGSSPFYPSSVDPKSSLTIFNSSSSHFTLTVMSYVSLAIPFVLAYIIYVWRLMNKEPITEKDINDEFHPY